MKPEPKLRGGSDSELTKFKRLWRDTLPESSRDYWRSQFASNATQPQIRADIMAKTGINLLYDRQLTEFRDWEFQQRLRESESEQMQLDQEQLQREFPDWTLDQVRDRVLKNSYARAIATGDFALGLKTVDRDLKGRSTLLDEEKLRLAASEKIDLAFEELARDAKGDPVALELLAKFRERVKTNVNSPK